MKNISSSEYKDKIALKNVGISDQKKMMTLPLSSQMMTAKAKNHMSGKRVRITDLKEITKGMENIIIKSDCEGEEHSIFNEEADLDNIYKMQIEYHKGVQALPKILQEKGFRIRIQKVANTILSGEVGWIYALK